MSTQRVNHHGRSRSGLAVLAVAAATAVGSVASTASATAIQYTMTWSNVTGSYGGTGFTGQTMTLQFNYDTTNVGLQGPFPRAVFVNGAGISVTLGTGGSILNNAALDNVAANNSALLVIDSTTVYFGISDGTTYTGDRGFLFGLTGGPAVANFLTTEWSGATGPTGQAGVSAGWGPTAPGVPLVIGGLQLAMTGASGGGTWSSGSPSVIPGSGLAAIGTLGLAGIARRRRR